MNKGLEVVIREISIHALREEGDPAGPFTTFQLPAISIHALREEGDGMQPTGETGSAYFYPRPPRGGRQTAGAALRQLH